MQTVVYDVKDTKFEWNSQLLLRMVWLVTVVYDVKDTKFEWNSQHMKNGYLTYTRLFMMSKIQNLNGTHNSITFNMVQR